MKTGTDMEWGRTVTQDRVERVVAYDLADAMIAAASHLRASASALRAEFGGSRCADRVTHADEDLVTHILTRGVMDVPMRYHQAVDVHAPIEMTKTDMELVAARAKTRIDAVVANLMGVNDVASV